MNPALVSKFSVRILSLKVVLDHQVTEVLLAKLSTLVDSTSLWKVGLEEVGRICFELPSKLSGGPHFQWRLLRRPEASSKFSSLQLILRGCRFRPSGTPQVSAYKPTNDRGSTRARELDSKIYFQC